MVSLTKDISSVTARFRDARVVRLLPFGASQVTRPFIATPRIRFWLASEPDQTGLRRLRDGERRAVSAVTNL
jgi:hypothetical protein